MADVILYCHIERSKKSTCGTYALHEVNKNQQFLKVTYYYFLIFSVVSFLFFGLRVSFYYTYTFTKLQNAIRYNT